MKQDGLPSPFLEEMKILLGGEYSAYLDSFEEERLFGLRVNTGKLSPGEFARLSPFALTPIPWISNGFYYKEAEKPAKDPYYYAGLYYLQEPSAMTPASLLPVEPGDRVLDLCAAPGGKSTELGARLKGKGLLVSNDISSSRARALLKNLELFGISNCCVTSETPERLGEVFPLFFDKILVDAPCSGEGMFRKDRDMIKGWLEKGPDYYARIQRSIVVLAADMLKPGGMILYSTCTFSRMEDEAVVEELLTARPDFELIPLPKFEGASDGIGLEGCLRLFPHRIRGEGHFMALLRKKGETGLDEETGRGGKASWTGEKPRPGLTGSGAVRECPLPEEAEAFLEAVGRPLHRDRIQVKNQMVYQLPEGWKPDTKLRCLRTGLLLGELKKGRFEPSQALAMALKREEFPQCVSLNREDGRVLRFLKGETLSLEGEERAIKGWGLLCVDGFPLGFVKGAGVNLKNKYYPGWRWL